MYLNTHFNRPIKDFDKLKKQGGMVHKYDENSIFARYGYAFYNRT